MEEIQPSSRTEDTGERPESSSKVELADGSEPIIETNEEPQLEDIPEETKRSQDFTNQKPVTTSDEPGITEDITPAAEEPIKTEQEEQL